MKRKKRKRRAVNLRYMVAVPIPALDRRGQPLAQERILPWRDRIEELLTQRFGGVTPIQSPGRNQVGDGHGGSLTLYEKGQILLLAACKDRAAFRMHRAEIKRLVEDMGKSLDQDSVIVLACPADSFLVELP